MPEIKFILNSTPSTLRREHPRMRAFNYASLLPVTCQRWRSHYSIRRGRSPIIDLHADFTALAEQSYTLRD